MEPSRTGYEPTRPSAGGRLEQSGRRPGGRKLYKLRRFATVAALAGLAVTLLAPGCQRQHRRADSEPSGSPSEQVQTQPDPRFPRRPDATAPRSGFWVEQPTETGSVSATELANSLARHLDALRSTCCSPSAKCSGLQGRIALQLRLSPDGNVERASIGETSVYDRQLRACIRERVSTWRLATHESPQSVDVVVPLRLRFPPDDAGP